MQVSKKYECENEPNYSRVSTCILCVTHFTITLTNMGNGGCNYFYCKLVMADSTLSESTPMNEYQSYW